MKPCPIPKCTCLIHHTMAVCPWHRASMSMIDLDEIINAQNQCANGEITESVRNSRQTKVYKKYGHHYARKQ